MLRFFRQIRQRLLAENRFSKYLLYAIGEIVLVVVGILIALQINNWNEQQKNEEKVRAILSDIMQELVNDVDKINGLMHYYKKRDSTAHLVINNLVDQEDYEKNESQALFTITSFHNRVDLTQDGYSLLTQNMDIIPDAYKGILKTLTRIYKVDKKWVDKYDKEMGDFVEEIHMRRMNTYPWFTGTNASDRNSQIEYMLNDFRHKNEVFEYRSLGVGNHLRFSLLYRLRAIECYKQIAALLNRPLYHESFVIDQEASGDLIGDWKVVGEPGIVYSFYEDDKRIYFKNNLDQRSHEVYLLSPYKILTHNLWYGSLVKEGDKRLVKFHWFTLMKLK